MNRIFLVEINMLASQIRNGIDIAQKLHIKQNRLMKGKRKEG